MSKTRAWTVLALFILAGIYLAWTSGWQNSLVAIATFCLATMVVAAIAVFAFGADRLGASVRNKLFPAPELWVKPRRASSLANAQLVARLEERLDLISRDGRAASWRDRHSGQIWQSHSYDFEFTEDNVYEPGSGEDRPL